MGQMTETRTLLQRFLFVSLQPPQNTRIWFALSLTLCWQKSLQSDLRTAVVGEFSALLLFILGKQLLCIS